MARNRKQDLLMLEAAAAGKLDQVKNYLKDDASTNTTRTNAKSINVNYKDKQGYTALHRACVNGHEPVVDVLLHHGANLEAETLLKQTVLMLACQHYKDHLIAKLLLDRGANIHARDMYGSGPLHYACGNVTLVRLLLSRGANVNALCHDHMTPLHYACLKGRKKCIKELLCHGADVTIQNCDGRVPLDFATSKKCHSIIEIFKKHKESQELLQNAPLDSFMEDGSTQEGAILSPKNLPIPPESQVAPNPEEYEPIPSYPQEETLTCDLIDLGFETPDSCCSEPDLFVADPPELFIADHPEEYTISNTSLGDYTDLYSSQLQEMELKYNARLDDFLSEHLKEARSKEEEIYKTLQKVVDELSRSNEKILELQNEIGMMKEEKAERNNEGGNGTNNDRMQKWKDWDLVDTDFIS